MRGGCLRPFGYGWFIREHLLGETPYSPPKIDPEIGVTRGGIFHDYERSLMRATAFDRATREE